MNNKELDFKLQKLYEKGNHKEIIQLILSLPKEQLNDDIRGQLAVAYNNTAEFDLAIETLNSLSEGAKSNHTWFYKIAYAYSGKSDIGNANLNIDRALYTLETNKPSISNEEYNYFRNLYNDLKEYIQSASIHYEANSIDIDNHDSIIKDISSILSNYIENEIIEGSIVIKKWNIFINASIASIKGRNATVNYYISSTDWDRDIFECCASAGKDANTSVGLSNGSFIFGIMTGIKAMNENRIFDEVETEFVGKKHKWKVYTSNLVNMGADNGKPKNVNIYWDMFKDDILKRIGNQKICYIKIYGAKAGNNYSIGELRINDVNIPELADKVNEYVKTWNETDFSSDKQFFFLVQDNETYTPYPFSNDEILKFIQEYSNIVLNTEESEESYEKLEELSTQLTKDYSLSTDLFLFLPEICADNEFFNELHSSEKINFNFESEEKNCSLYKTQLYTYYLINNYLFELFRENAFNGNENELYAKFINMSALYNIYSQVKEDYEKKNKTLENLKVNLSFSVNNNYEIR